MSFKSKYLAARDCTGRFILLLVALLVIVLTPLRTLFRRRPFRDYVFIVAYRWLRLSLTLMNACGVKSTVNTNLE